MKKFAFFVFGVLLMLLVVSCSNTGKPAKDIVVTKVVVDYSQPIETLIAAGHYDVNGDIFTSLFPVGTFLEPPHERDTMEIEFRLFSSPQNLSPQEVVSLMSQDDFRPATFIELLAVSSQYPELQEKFTIVALGTVWRYPYCSTPDCVIPVVPIVAYYQQERWINFMSIKYICWHNRFLGIRK